MSARSFLDGRVVLHPGDCREVLSGFADASIDSIVTDPPYALVSIGKRFGKPGAAPTRDGDVYSRASAGFMGQQWDTGETAFAAEFWAEALRVLKPGGHLVAFSGTRTYHRMVCAIEDAGFEIRDQLAWIYGSGFPKSHDVSKAIDKRRDWNALPRLQAAIRAAREGLGISQSEAARRMGLIRADERLGGGGFMWFETGLRAPTREQWPSLKAALGIGTEFDACFEEVEREITGVVDEWDNRSNYALTSKDGFRRDKPASDLAKEWAGWGTALKPAWEPIVLARRPLVGSVAEAVLSHGTGAINIDGCRVHAEDAQGGAYVIKRFKPGATLDKEGGTWKPEGDGPLYQGEMKPGRWPANIVHDGSDEVVSAFPDREARDGATKGGGMGFSGGSLDQRVPVAVRSDSGSAARFFYSAKADADDRIGSKHPTVKPVDLMQWLCRMVTPPGGTVLDPFAGTGTTGEAAFREGFRAVLVEREEAYQDDIARRMELALAGPATRKAESAKARGKAAAPIGGLFAEAAE